MKLIKGKMNIPFTQCRIGYAEGVERPKKIVKIETFNPIVKLRKRAA